MIVSDDVRAFLGPAGAGADAAQIETHLRLVTAMTKQYTRGRGFDAANNPEEPLEAVIISATARLLQNPTHAELQTSGPFTVRPGTFSGWTLAELAVLHTYRRRAQ